MMKYDVLMDFWQIMWIIGINSKNHDQNDHDQKIWIIEKFEQKIDFGEKYIFG